MAVKTKKTYYALRILLACGVFYFSMVGKTYAATDCNAAVHDTLDHAGTFTLAANVDGVGCIITADNVIIDGQGIYSINTANGSAVAVGHDGYDFTIQNVTDVSGGVTSNGFNATGLGQNGSNGGNITIINSTIRSNIVSNGGSSAYGTGGVGGIITIKHSSPAFPISALGGASSAPTALNGGAGGSVVVQIGSVVGDAINVTGGSSQYGNGGVGGYIAFQGNSTSNSTSTATGGYSYNGLGGNGGTILIDDSNLLSIFANGGESNQDTGGAGGSITIQNTSNVTGQARANGGEGSDLGGAAGTIIINNSILNNVGVIGGSADAGGIGGTLTISNDSNVNIASVTGGAGNSGNGGNGGTLTVQNSVLTNYAQAAGGYSYYGNGGNGGNMTFTNSSVYGAYANGGGSYYATDGNGGGITLINSESSYLLQSNGNIGGNIVITNSNAVTVSNTGTVAGTLTITDAAPTVALIGDASMTIAYVDTYTEQGATASDTKYEVTDLTSSIVTSGTVDAAAGLYEIEYSATDTGTLPEWNGVQLVGGITDDGVAPQTTTVTRTVTRSAIPDADDPVITITGDNPINLTVGNTYVEQGATALDAIDGVVTAVASGSVNVNVPGTYTITYTAEDAAHNTATATRTVNVNSAPSGSSGSSGSRLRSNLSPTTPPTDCKTGDLFSSSTGKACATTSPTNKFIFTKNLKYLVIDNEAKELQKFLNTHGYPVAITGAGSLGKETTKFGLLTKKAVIKFQLANKLTGDGIVGPATRAKINALNL